MKTKTEDGLVYFWLIKLKGFIRMLRNETLSGVVILAFNLKKRKLSVEKLHPFYDLTLSLSLI